MLWPPLATALLLRAVCTKLSSYLGLLLHVTIRVPKLISFSPFRLVLQRSLINDPNMVLYRFAVINIRYLILEFSSG